MNVVVVDASALLAVAHNEVGTDNVLAVRQQAIISAVNACEVYQKLLRCGLPEAAISTWLQTLVAEIVPFTWSRSRLAAQWHVRSRDLGLSLADCICLALGEEYQCTILTADQSWLNLQADLQVELIR